MGLKLVYSHIEAHNQSAFKLMNPSNGIETIGLCAVLSNAPDTFKLMNPSNGIETNSIK